MGLWDEGERREVLQQPGEGLEDQLAGLNRLNGDLTEENIH